MTVTTELARKSFPWTGVETAFACGFPAEDVAHLRVFFTTVAGVTSQLTLGVNYSASLANGTNIATVLPILMPAASGTVVVERRTPALVTEVLADGQDFSLEVIQRLHDRMAMIGGEFRARLGRAIVLADGAELGTGNFDLGGSGISNLKPGAAPTDAATVSQVQAMQVADGNVPSPVLGDVGKFLVATAAGVFGWVAFQLTMLADGLFTANPAGRAKFAAGFVDTGLLADGALSADAAGRAKMADGFLTPAKLSTAPGDIAALQALLNPLPPRYRSGGTLSNDPTDPTNDLRIAPLSWRDSANTRDLVTVAQLTKQLDVAFAEYVAPGTPSGLRDPADNLSGPKWFNVFAIGGAGKNTDVFASTSLTPTLPPGFTARERLGSVWWNGSTILAFLQVGRVFRYINPLLDVSTSAASTTGSNSTMSVPPGVRVDVLQTWRVLNVSNPGLLYLRTPDQANTAPSTTAAPLAFGGNTNTVYMGQARTVSASGALGIRVASANTEVLLVTHGYEELELA